MQSRLPNAPHMCSADDFKDEIALTTIIQADRVGTAADTTPTTKLALFPGCERSAVG